MDPYKVLIEVMKTESFTRAAEHLYTSQPSVSRDIKRLELKYHVKIFEFKSPYLKLTRDGEKLLQYALKILSFFFLHCSTYQWVLEYSVLIGI